MSYGWNDDTGESESTFKSTKGVDYTSARKAYEEPVTPKVDSKKSFTEPRESCSSRIDKIPTPAPIGKDISTDSTHPWVVASDDTGSMGDWIDIILEKLALLGKEAERYAPNYALSVWLTGDARCDEHALQIRDFDSGPSLTEQVDALAAQHGGGDEPESYGLAAYYGVYHCNIEKAVKPIFTLILDALPHMTVRPDEIKKFIGDKVQSDLSTVNLFHLLREKFTVYIVIKGEKGGTVYNFWADIVGEQQIIPMSEPRDVVEILIGIYAGEMGEYADFEMRSSRRHSDKPDRVSRVGKSLKSVAEKSAVLAKRDSDGKSGKSIRSGSGKKSKKGGKSLKSKSLIE